MFHCNIPCLLVLTCEVGGWSWTSQNAIVFSRCAQHVHRSCTLQWRTVKPRDVFAHNILDTNQRVDKHKNFYHNHMLLTRPNRQHQLRNLSEYTILNQSILFEKQRSISLIIQLLCQMCKFICSYWGLPGLLKMHGVAAFYKPPQGYIFRRVRLCLFTSLWVVHGGKTHHLWTDSISLVY